MNTQNKLYGCDCGECPTKPTMVNFSFSTIDRAAGTGFEEGLISLGYDSSLNAGAIFFGTGTNAQLVTSRIIDLSVDDENVVTVHYFNGYFVDKFNFKAFDETAVREIVEANKSEYQGIEYIDVNTKGEISLKYNDLFAKIKEELAADGIFDNSAVIEEYGKRISAVEKSYVSEINLDENASLLRDITKTQKLVIKNSKLNEAGEVEASEVVVNIPTEEYIASLEERINDFAENSQVGVITEKVNELATGIAELKTGAAETAQKFDDVNSKIEFNTSYIDDVESASKAQKEDLDKEIARIDNDIDDVEADVEAIDGKVEEVKSTLEKAVLYKDFTYTNSEGETSTRKTVELANYDTISGLDTEGTGHNLVMVSKWDVADFGSTGLPMNLNSKNGVVTINDDKVVATLDDIAALNGGANNTFATKLDLEDYVKKEEAEDYASKSDVAEVKDALEGYATKEEIADFAAKSDVDSVKDELINYATKDELDNYRPNLDEYVTKAEADSEYATKAEIENFASKDEIPSVDGLASEEVLNAVKSDVDEIKEVVKGSVLYTPETMYGPDDEEIEVKAVILNNGDYLAAKDSEGSVNNIATISMYGVTEIGSNGLHLNLNTSDEVTINGIKKIATVDDIEEKFVKNETLDKTKDEIIAELTAKVEDLEKKLEEQINDKSIVVTRTAAEILGLTED